MSSLDSFFKDKKHGYGVFKYVDGRIYKGNYIDGAQDGPGLLISKNGQER